MRAQRDPAPLADYVRKRDFGATPEPGARVRRSRANALSYVIQRHAARSLHYDFRLELDGVLKSWAVPKGPSDSIGVRRLAVQVEDHPLDYASFQGDIPAGQYGAGHVDIWDRGRWTPVGDPRAGLREGHLKFDLKGERLNGRFALIRMKPREGGRGDNWLLIHERPPGPAAAAASLQAKSTSSTARVASAATRRARPTKRTAAADKTPRRPERLGSNGAKKTRARRGVTNSSTQDQQRRPTAKQSPKLGPSPREGAPVVVGVTITNAGREVRDGGGATKLDVVRYHEAMESALMPEIANRPLALIKCPGGDFAHCFFQKHADSGTPGRTAADSPPYVHFPKLRDVIAAVQNGVFEFHSWGASFPRIDRPDRITLDLDPDAALPWSATRDAAELVRSLLDELALAWFLKTTGGKGLHFVIPLARRYDWAEVKRVARAMAERLVAVAPKLFISTASKASRSNRVFVDYLRNAEGATAVAAYSLRARPGLPVSMPIAWDDLRQDVRGTRFSLYTAPEWVAKRKADPWAAYAKTQQTISAGVRKALGI